jgi:hypothetical protein
VEIVADDALELLKSLKVQPGLLSHDIAVAFMEEMKRVPCVKKRYHRLQRILGLGFRGFAERVKSFFGKKQI